MAKVRLVWNEDADITPSLKRAMEKAFEKNAIVDVFLEGFCADMTNYAGYAIQDSTLRQVTGGGKFFPTGWVAVREEKADIFKTIWNKLKKKICFGGILTI